MSMNEEAGPKFCEDCGRRVGVACTCGMTFLERMRSVQIDTWSLKVGPRKGHRKDAN